MSDDSRELSRMEDILSGEDYLPKKPMSRIEELLLDGAMVPKVDSTDNGKVLKVIDGEWKPGEDVSGDNLPPVSSLDNGKVLKVVSGEWNIGSDKSDIVMVQMSVSYASFKDSNQVTLPTNIKSVLLANYYNNPPIPTYLITTDSVIFQPIEVNKSSGTTPLVQIRWGRFHSEFDSVTRESNVYNDSIIYNTQDNDTIARFTKSAALQTIPPVDSTDVNKVMQVGNDGTWQANDLPTYDDVPPVAAGNVGMYLKATATGEYGWASIPKDALFLSFDFLGGQISLPTNLGITMANSNAPIFLKNASIGKSDYGKIFYPVSRDYTITLGVVENASWECISVETVNGKDITYVEKITYHMDADNHTETATYSKDELKAGGGVAVPPVIFDDGNLKKMEISGFPGIEKVYLTPTAYSNLTTAQKEDLSKIYYVSDYEFATYNDGTLVLRTDSSNNSLLYFVGVVCTNSNPLTMPSELAAYIGNRRYPDSYGYYDPTDTTSVDCYINCNWSGDNTKYWAQSGRHSGTIINDTPVYGVMNPAEGYGQELVYSDPFDVLNGFTIYYGGKQYTDFDIPDPLPSVTSSDNGKVLKVVSGEWAAGNEDGGLEVVKLSQTAYDSLSDAQKKNGKMYLIDASIFTGGIPRVSGADSKITASSNVYQPWLAFDGNDHTAGVDGDGWVPNNGDDQWIKYQFASATPINKIRFKAVSRNLTAWSGIIYIEGSNDDTTWENILSTKQSITTELPNRNSSSVEFNEIANGKSYIYIRLRINNQAYQRFELAEFDADITTLTYDSIYYMDRQYSTMYEPVPEVTMADAGKALIVNASGEWDKGDLPASIAPVRLSKTAYDNLTPAQKTDTTKLYLIDGSIITDETLISPDDLAADDGKTIGTSAEGNRPVWKLFNGIKPTSGFNDCFCPAYNSDPCYAGYHFTDKAHKITKVCYRVYWTGNSGTITNTVYIEGSNDGTNWTDIGGGAIPMSIEQNGYSDYEVPCDMNEWSYVRMRFGSAVNVTGSNKFFAVSYMEIYATEANKVYNAICYNNAEYASLDPSHYRREISQYDYDQLPDTKNSDGIIYFITDNS